MLVFVAISGLAPTAHAQTDTVAMLAAGARIDAGEPREGCRDLEAVLVNWSGPRDQLAAIFERHDGFRRWVRACVTARMRRIRRQRNKARALRMLHRLERSPWMVDPMAAARVRSEIARIRRWGVGAPAQPPPIEPTGLPARLSSTTAATVLRVAFRAAANEIQMCLDRLTIRGSSPGAMEIVLTVRADGTVETAQVSTRGGGNVGYPSCIEQVLQRLRFPPPDPTGPMTIRYPLRIDPG